MPAPRLTIDELPEDTTVSGSEMLVVSDAGSSKKLILSRITAIPQAALDAHISASADAHDATAVSAVASSLVIDGTDVQSQLSQLASGLGTVQGQADSTASDLGAHLVDATDAHDAVAISLVPIAGITGATVQAALEELNARVAALETP